MPLPSAGRSRRFHVLRPNSRISIKNVKPTMTNQSWSSYCCPTLFHSLCWLFFLIVCISLIVMSFDDGRFLHPSTLTLLSLTSMGTSPFLINRTTIMQPPAMTEVRSESSRTTTTTTTTIFNRTCTQQQLERIQQQLSPNTCIKYEHRPWTADACSFSQATKCPEPKWLHDFYNSHPENNDETIPASITMKKSKQQFISIFVGCNKAIDAIHTLRMASHNPKHDATIWTETLTQGRQVQFAYSSCRQENKTQIQLSSPSSSSSSSSNPNRFRPARVYCIEPLPVTFVELQRTKMALQYTDDELVLDQVALDAQPGKLKVPTFGQIGTESKGITHMRGDCNKPKPKDPPCLEIPILTLDQYTRERLGNQTIQYLSIDVEGHDYKVLKGGQSETLHRVEYLEFEYNWKEPWYRHSLRDAIDLLESNGFVCYWPGLAGNIWRITNCWLDHYKYHYWSNVACVNTKLPSVAKMAFQMQEMFYQTLQRDIHYE